YDADNELATLTRYADQDGTQPVGSSSYAYDDASNLTYIEDRDGAGGLLADFQYSYDADNQLASETDNGVTTSYGYDDAGQLTQAGSASYSYDGSGNRTLAGYQTGADNRLLSDGTTLRAHPHR